MYQVYAGRFVTCMLSLIPERAGNVCSGNLKSKYLAADVDHPSQDEISEPFPFAMMAEGPLYSCLNRFPVLLRC